ncbi:MAG: sigma-70 family RNA polymerase sigma factor [Chloroflexota bacterium]|nr:sigma-70 family RNA polymerase sigma factor [Chloroflexota bacterium]
MKVEPYRISVNKDSNNEALIAACRAGDPKAWELLVERYQRLVYSIPRRAGLDEETSADVFGYVFASLVEHLDRLDQPSRVGAWLATTAKRETWRLARSRQRYVAPPEGYETDFMAEIPTEEPLPEETVLRLEEQHRIRTAVEMLDERCRELLTLLFYRAESPAYTDIAAALGIPEGSIGPTRARCLQKVRRVLEKLW